MLIKSFLLWVVIALVIASPISYFIVTGWLSNFAYRTELSWWIFALSGLFTLSIALLTVGWQSWKAANGNPVNALKCE
jgi:putative ABC transport system permease protein